MKNFEMAKTLLSGEVESYHLYVDHIRYEPEISQCEVGFRFLEHQPGELKINVYDSDIAKAIYNNIDGYELKIFRNNTAIIYLKGKPLLTVVMGAVV